MGKDSKTNKDNIKLSSKIASKVELDIGENKNSQHTSAKGISLEAKQSDGGLEIKFSFSDRITIKSEPGNEIKVQTDKGGFVAKLERERKRGSRQMKILEKSSTSKAKISLSKISLSKAEKIKKEREDKSIAQDKGLYK